MKSFIEGIYFSQDKSVNYRLSKADINLWINAINELIDSPEKRNEMGDAAYTLIEKEFSWEKIALDFVNILKKEGVKL